MAEPTPYDPVPHGPFIHPQTEEPFASLPFPDGFTVDDAEALDFSPGFMSDLSFDDFDFSVDDLLLPFPADDDDEEQQPPPDSGSPPPPDSGSGVSSPESGNSASDPGSAVKSEATAAPALKRKKGREDGNPNPNPNPNQRAVRARQSPTSSSDEANSSSCVFNAGSEEEEEKRRRARLMRNRESAQLSRQRKKLYVGEMEEKVKALHATIADLNNKIHFFMAENASLRQQLSSGKGGSAPLLPAAAVYPPPPMWIPAYALKPQGSQVPLVPIPRLRPQTSVSVPRGNNRKAENKKAGSKSKRVASFSLMSVMFFVLVFWGLVPLMNFVYDGNQTQVRVVPVRGRVSGANQTSFAESYGKSGFERGGFYRGDREVEADVRPRNSSEPLIASLYVPRNDRLVKIDGNLIIHSVLASEKALASSRATNGRKNNKPTASSGKEAKETGLVVSGNMASPLAVLNGMRSMERHSHVYKNDHPRALASASGETCNDNLKSNAADGLQQWFREGLAGPLLSSGMCTEVFQFEVAAASGGIIPATPVTNATKNSSTPHPVKIKNRRIMYPTSIPLPGSTTNGTEEHAQKPSEGNDYHGNKSSSSMIVSVLVDPREAGDGDGDGVLTPKSLSRIFVVVLLDSIKYVTYSCVLPLKTSVPHLVTA
ncbi:hypothetical protein QJS04_geneDACA003277 [Acorus gramineus]|uniref:BZIP domain-containing protein n=1 Tax=Acorus gramineus TaxID=55184 RepID=A0AAV9BL04_ACOGR|nr:hypothetical protein QJS04_geneDACA003277 [Acorus gramineus]